MADNRDSLGGMVSPSGFVFGVQGWNWSDPKATSLTFFLDGTVMVSDQYGRPIRGSVIDSKEVRFAMSPPPVDDTDEALFSRLLAERRQLGSHAQVVRALEADRIDWTKLARSGWPQLAYEELKKLARVPPTPMEELHKIRDPKLRKDAMRLRREADESQQRELQEIDDEMAAEREAVAPAAPAVPPRAEAPKK